MVSESDVTLLVRQASREVKDELSVGSFRHTHEVNQLDCLSGLQHAIRFAVERDVLEMF